MGQLKNLNAPLAATAPKSPAWISASIHDAGEPIWRCVGISAVSEVRGEDEAGTGIYRIMNRSDLLGYSDIH